MFANRFAAKLTSFLLTMEFANRFAALLTTKTSEVSPLQSKMTAGRSFYDRKYAFMLGSNCPTLLVQHIVNFSLFNKNKEVVDENNDVEPTMLSTLTPVLSLVSLSVVKIASIGLRTCF